LVKVAALGFLLYNSEVMTKQAAEERRKGWGDARQVIPLLQEKWPLAFPTKNYLVKPLAASVPRVISEALGWNLSYARGVISVWKRRNAYCDAILRGGLRIDIDGNATMEPVDENSRQQAQKELAARAAKALRHNRTPPPVKARTGLDTPHPQPEHL
jgi:sRNA-binding protein